MFGKKKKEKDDCKCTRDCSNCSNEKASDMKSGSRSTKSCSNCGTREKSVAAPHPTKSCGSKTEKSCSNCGSKTTKSCSNCGSKSTKNCK